MVDVWRPWKMPRIWIILTGEIAWFGEHSMAAWTCPWEWWIWNREGRGKCKLLLAISTVSVRVFPGGTAEKNSCVSARRILIYWPKESHWRFFRRHFPVAQHLFCLKFQDSPAEVVQGPGNLSCHQFCFKLLLIGSVISNILFFANIASLLIFSQF